MEQIIQFHSQQDIQWPCQNLIYLPKHLFRQCYMQIIAYSWLRQEFQPRLVLVSKPQRRKHRLWCIL